MTIDDLRAIAARDDEAQRHSGLSQAALDRGVLLGLLRKLGDAARRYVDAPKQGMGSGTIRTEAEIRLRSVLRRVDALREPAPKPTCCPVGSAPSGALCIACGHNLDEHYFDHPHACGEGCCSCSAALR